MNFSVVIIAYNEAHRIEPLLQSIRYAGEVLVIDSHSTDETASLCRKYGARVLQHDFEGYGQQKQYGVEQANYDWIFSLDADEVPDPETWEHLKAFTEKEPEVKAWYIRRQLVFLGKRFRFGRESNDRQLRFFHRKFARWSTPAVHESVVTSEKTGTLRGYTAHKSYESLDNYFGKINKYTSLAARELVEKGKTRSNWINMLGLGINFIKSYFFQLNLFNGYPGFCWSVFSSVYSLIKYTKAKELKDKTTNS